jgi:microcystin degradation protein MlrC
VRIAIYQVFQETNTFNPLTTGINEFKQGGLYFGDEIIENMRGIGEIGGFLSVINEEADNIEVVPLVRALAMSGGRVTSEALNYFKEALVDGLRENSPLDGIYISMHGAAASENVDDFEGYLLSKARSIVGSEIPIVVSLDHHANITKKIVESVDGLIAYQTQPHDPYETGIRATHLLLRIIRKDINPTIAWQKIPMVAPADRGITSAWPMKEWFDLARSKEKLPGVISISNFPVQPWLDVEDFGWSAVVITNNNFEMAQSIVTELANKAWELREEFWKIQRVLISDAIKRAKEAKEGTFIICDTSDSVLSGSPGDSTYILRELLEQKFDCVALLPIVDSEVVDVAINAGVDKEISVLIGGKIDKTFNKPIEVNGKVVGFSHESLSFPFGQWGNVALGRCAILEIGSIILFVSESGGIGGTHPDMYKFFGLDPAEAKVIIVKTYYHYQNFRSIMKDAYMVDCPGLSQWDLRQFEWKNIPRPIYPLDELSHWSA